MEYEDDSSLVVLPGELITTGRGFIRGHGTFVETSLESNIPLDDDDDVENNQSLVASLGGAVTRVNKLISVIPVSSRYSGDVGDVVIGRVIEVGNKQWKVDLNARNSATLLLGSINLPGGALRRRTLEDQLQMRQLFKENDLVSAEVSSFHQHGGGVSIHTRSMRYGKLLNGVLVSVPANLIKRTKQHFVNLPCGVHAVFGLNGFVWLTVTRQESEEDDIERSRNTEQMDIENKIHGERDIDSKTRVKIARVRNCIKILVSGKRMIHEQSVMKLYELSKQASPKLMLAPDMVELLLKKRT